MAPNLESERLFYYPISTNHCSQKYVNWLNDPEVYQYLETGGDYTMDKLNEYLNLVTKSPDILFWAIHEKTSGIHIGNIKIDPINKRHEFGEYGILMGEKEYWGRGFAKEASITIIKYCFEVIGLRKINLGVVEQNYSAVQLYKKLGFEIEGIYKKHGIYNSTYCDIFRMAIFNSTIK